MQWKKVETVSFFTLVDSLELLVRFHSWGFLRWKRIAFLDHSGLLQEIIISMKNKIMVIVCLKWQNSARYFECLWLYHRFLLFSNTNNRRKIIHNLCCVFFPNSDEAPFYYSILQKSSHHCRAVGSASAWQTPGCGFEPVMMRYCLAENIPVSCHIWAVFDGKNLRPVMVLWLVKCLVF